MSSSYAAGGTYATSAQDATGGGGVAPIDSAGTTSRTWTINTDAAAALAENPELIFLGGDGGADIFRTREVQDSALETFSMIMERSTGGGAFAAVGTPVVWTSAQLRGAAAAVGTPFFSFQAETDLGVWRAAAGTLGFADGGANMATIAAATLAYNGTLLDLNADATAAALESPSWRIQGGDGVVAPNDDIYRVSYTLDTVNERSSLVANRSRNGGAYAEVATNLQLGTVGQTANLSQTIGFNAGSGAAARSHSITCTNATMFLNANANGGVQIGLAGLATTAALQINEADTGFYQIAANRLGTTAGGVQMSEMDGQNALADGQTPLLLRRRAAGAEAVVRVQWVDSGIAGAGIPNNSKVVIFAS